MEQKTPLGHVELDSGAIEIYPMNDFFLNFTYDNPENWESLPWSTRYTKRTTWTTPQQP